MKSLIIFKLETEINFLDKKSASVFTVNAGNVELQGINFLQAHDRAILCVDCSHVCFMVYGSVKH